MTDWSVSHRLRGMLCCLTLTQGTLPLWCHITSPVPCVSACWRSVSMQTQSSANAMTQACKEKWAHACVCVAEATQHRNVVLRWCSRVDIATFTNVLLSQHYRAPNSVKWQQQQEHLQTPIDPDPCSRLRVSWTDLIEQCRLVVWRRHQRCHVNTVTGYHCWPLV